MRNWFLFYLFTFAISTNRSLAQDTINWTSLCKLKWQDFRGTPDSVSKFAAVSSIGINYKLTYNQKTFSYRIMCFFDRSESWTKSNDSTLLAHENTHFAIAELFARRLNMLFKKYKFSPLTVTSDFASFAKTIKAERRKMDSQYDSETKLSTDKKKQVYWTKKVAMQLSMIQPYD